MALEYEPEYSLLHMDITQSRSNDESDTIATLHIYFYSWIQTLFFHRRKNNTLPCFSQFFNCLILIDHKRSKICKMLIHKGKHKNNIRNINLNVFCKFRNAVMVATDTVKIWRLTIFAHHTTVDPIISATCSWTMKCSCELHIRISVVEWMMMFKSSALS